MHPPSKPTVAEGDIAVDDFADLLAQLPANPPITVAMESGTGRENKVWYSSQREHMVAWFRGQMTTGHGAYSRDTPNYSSKVTYNRLQCPPALIWIAEVLGADPGVLRPVALEAKEMDRRTACGFIRKHVPWEQIFDLAQAKQPAPTKPKRPTKTKLIPRTTNTKKFRTPKGRYSIEFRW